jgi:hypothetical protein
MSNRVAYPAESAYSRFAHHPEPEQIIRYSGVRLMGSRCAHARKSAQEEILRLRAFQRFAQDFGRKLPLGFASLTPPERLTNRSFALLRISPAGSRCAHARKPAQAIIEHGDKPAARFAKRAEAAECQVPAITG